MGIIARRRTLSVALVCAVAGCGGGSADPPAPPAERPATVEDLRGLQGQAGGHLFWLGESFRGARLHRAERSQDGVGLSYGPDLCAGDSGCTSQLTVDTSLERRPDTTEASCWRALGRAWLDWCEGTETADLYVGAVRVSIFAVNVTPDVVARAVRPFPRTRARLAATRRFSCDEADAFRGRLPAALRPRGCR